MSKAHDLQEAETRMAEVRSWTCATCDTMVDADGGHCSSCAAYWADVANGLFDDEDEADINCHMNNDGQSGAAGSEYCEFECPYRDE